MKVKVTSRIVYHKIAEVVVEVPDHVSKSEMTDYLTDHEHIYDEQADPMSNVIDTAVCALRRAIKTPKSDAKLIHTRRGMGYVIQEPDE